MSVVIYPKVAKCFYSKALNLRNRMALLFYSFHCDPAYKMFTLPILSLCSVPLYLAVTLVYGAEVSKELTPLWILGPLIVALYVKMLRGICALYVFSFKQTVNVVKNLPTYSLLAYDYIVRGKLKEDIRMRLLQPFIDIKNLDYKEAAKRKAKDIEVYLVEKYLDFVESIWPYYCRTIRFLKRANLI